MRTPKALCVKSTDGASYVSCKVLECACVLASALIAVVTSLITSSHNESRDKSVPAIRTA
jgi:hypothetical protein